MIELKTNFSIDGELGSVTLRKIKLKDKDAMISAIKQRKLPLVLISDGFAPFSILLSAAYTFIDYKKGLAIAKDLPMQFMLNLTGTHQLSKAVEAASPRSDSAYLMEMKFAATANSNVELLEGLYYELDFSMDFSKTEALTIFSARAEGRNWKYKKPV